MNTSVLIKYIGSPYVDSKIKLSEDELKDVYELAFKNRVALLLLSKHYSKDWKGFVLDKYKMLKDREDKTLEVVVRLANKLNKFDKDSYIIFKSLKPYPATPNDTDIIWMKNNTYKDLNSYLLKNGYIFHEWAPQQKTYFDEKGKDFVGHGKKGGTYYIDLYEEISTDYFPYLNKNNLEKFVYRKSINNEKINLLKPEPEIAILLMHNIFPERTFQLEHFYLTLYYFKDNFNKKLFVEFVKKNRLVPAIKTNLTIVAYIHKKYFGFVPIEISSVLDQFGDNNYELRRFIKYQENTPYMFSPYIFWYTFFNKLGEWYSFKGFLIQLFKMLNPIFFFDVLRSIKNRFSKEGTYHQE